MVIRSDGCDNIKTPTANKLVDPQQSQSSVSALFLRELSNQPLLLKRKMSAASQYPGRHNGCNANNSLFHEDLLLEIGWGRLTNQPHGRHCKDNRHGLLGCIPKLHAQSHMHNVSARNDSFFFIMFITPAVRALSEPPNKGIHTM